jgi:predicted RNase H-like HicB family nuclease
LDHYVYPALFESEEDGSGFTVTFPDLPGCITEGDDLFEAFKMAKEALALHLYSMEEDTDEIPQPTDPSKLEKVDGGLHALIDVRTGPIRDQQLNKSVTKNVTLPKWLELEANKANINFSQVLQFALKEQLNIIEKDKPEYLNK